MKRDYQKYKQNREYIVKQINLAFSEQKEVDNYFSLVENFNYMLGNKRLDKLIVLTLNKSYERAKKDPEYKKYLRNKIEEMNQGE